MDGPYQTNQQSKAMPMRLGRGTTRVPQRFRWNNPRPSSYIEFPLRPQAGVLQVLDARLPALLPCPSVETDDCALCFQEPSLCSCCSWLIAFFFLSAGAL